MSSTAESPSHSDANDLYGFVPRYSPHHERRGSGCQSLAIPVLPVEGRALSTLTLLKATKSLPEKTIPLYQF